MTIIGTADRLEQFLKEHPLTAVIVALVSMTLTACGVAGYTWVTDVRVEKAAVQVEQEKFRAQRAEAKAEDATRTLERAKAAVLAQADTILEAIDKTIDDLDFDPPENAQLVRDALKKPVNQLKKRSEKQLFERYYLETNDAPASQ